MDRGVLSTLIINEIGAMVVAALQQAAPELARSDLDGIEQRLQRIGRQVFGRVVEATVLAQAETEPAAPPRCPDCHRAMRLVDRERPRQLEGLVGEYTLVRPYFVCDACHHGRAPLDERLGVGPGSVSPGLSRAACRLGIEAPFGEASDVLGEVLQIVVDPEAVRRVSEGIGQVAETETQAAIARVKRGEEPWAGAEVERPTSPVLAVAVDGAQVHLDDAWHEMKVGVVAPLGPKTSVDEETGRTVLRRGEASYGAGLEAAEEFWYRVYVEACRRGLGSLAVLVVVVLGDGADWIWRYAARFLAVAGVEVVEIVDVYHAFEHLWTVANAVFGTGTAQAAGWVEPLKRRLLQEGASAVLAALAELVANDELATDEVRKATAYFTEHAARMDYPRFLARQFPIGSGAVESACKTLVEARQKGAGMRWSRTGAQAIVTLRALHRSGRWPAFWATQPQRRRPLVFPRRLPATAPGRLKKQAA